MDGIKEDKRKVGVRAKMRRLRLLYNIVSLIQEGAIPLEELDGFSDELKRDAEINTNW